MKQIILASAEYSHFLVPMLLRGNAYTCSLLFNWHALPRRSVGARNIRNFSFISCWDSFCYIH